MTATPDTGLELYLQEPHSSERTAPLALSAAIHVIAASVLVLVHFDVVPSAKPWRSQAVIVSPVLPRQTPARERSSKLAPPKKVTLPPSHREARVFHAPVIERREKPSLAPLQEVAPPPIAPAASPIAIALPAVAPHLPVLPAPLLKTDNLSSAATASVAAIGGKLESSGFGAAGVAARATPASPQETVGSFGSTTAGKRVPTEAPRIPPGAFGNASAIALHAQAGVGKNDAAREVAETPVEILEKPKPKYTDEARRLGVEGEVLVEALFPRSGTVRVLRVIHGLGHGLDENAVAAAQAIRFRPATRAGRPVDSTAVVHILFEIAL